MRTTLDDMAPEECAFTITTKLPKRPGEDRKIEHVDFILREMTCENSIVEYTKQVIAANRSHDDTLRPLVNGDQTEKMAKATECFYEGQAELIAWILRTVDENPQPVAYPIIRLHEGGRAVEDISKPATFEEWIRQHISYKMRLKIVVAQDELNGMANISGNANALLQKAALGMAAEKIMDANTRELVDVVTEMTAATAATGTATPRTPNPGIKPARATRKGKGVGI